MHKCEIFKDFYMLNNFDDLHLLERIHKLLLSARLIKKAQMYIRKLRRKFQEGVERTTLTRVEYAE